MPNSVTIDGRGNTIQDAINEMWARMEPLSERGFRPVSEVEIIDESKKLVLETYQLDDPEFQARLNPVHGKRKSVAEEEDRAHEPESKDHYAYLARIRLEG